MANETRYWLKEIASCFRMSIKEFAKCLGYSRQALYQAACGMTRLDPRRLSVSQYKLDVMNKKMLEAEKTAAEENYEHRRKLIDSLIDRLSY